MSMQPGLEWRRPRILTVPQQGTVRLRRRADYPPR